MSGVVVAACDWHLACYAASVKLCHKNTKETDLELVKCSDNSEGMSIHAYMSLELPQCMETEICSALAR